VDAILRKRIVAFVESIERNGRGCLKESAGVLEPTSRWDCKPKGETKEKELLDK
jgi:hypothetical protein